MRRYLRLFRFDHALLAAFAVLVGSLLSRHIDHSLLVISLVTAMLVEIGAFTLNDYMDYESDVKNKRMDRPLVKGEIKREYALALSVISTLLALVLSWIVSNESFIFISIISVGNIIYDIYLKKLAVVGNIWVSLATAATFLYGGVVQSQITWAVVYVSTITFIANLAREILKTVMDVRGDKAIGAKTLPMIIGKKNAMYISRILFTLSAILAVTIPLFFDVRLSMLMLASAYVSFDCALDKRMKEKRRKSFIGFAFGVLGAFIYACIVLFF